MGSAEDQSGRTPKAYRKSMPYPRERTADNVEDTHTPREEWGVIVTDVAVDGLVAVPPSEKRIVLVDGQGGSSQVPSLAELCLCSKQLVKKPPSLGEVGLYQRV